LFVFACLFGVGMGLLASATKLVWFFIGYVLLQTALAAYLSVDTALIAQLVTGHPRRGLLLGVMNLSNTFPSIIVPVIALLAFNENEVAGILTNMFWGFAVAALFAGALVLLIRTVR
jgi:ABC-type transport system involved in cytochrome c biogenesis permease component